MLNLFKNFHVRQTTSSQIHSTNRVKRPQKLNHRIVHTSDRFQLVLTLDDINFDTVIIFMFTMRYFHNFKPKKIHKKITVELIRPFYKFSFLILVERPSIILTIRFIRKAIFFTTQKLLNIPTCIPANTHTIHIRQHFDQKAFSFHIFQSRPSSGKTCVCERVSSWNIAEGFFNIAFRESDPFRNYVIRLVRNTRFVIYSRN